MDCFPHSGCSACAVASPDSRRPLGTVLFSLSPDPNPRNSQQLRSLPSLPLGNESVPPFPHHRIASPVIFPNAGRRAGWILLLSRICIKTIKRSGANVYALVSESKERGRRRCHGKSDRYPLGVREVCSWSRAGRGQILGGLSGISALILTGPLLFQHCVGSQGSHVLEIIHPRAAAGRGPETVKLYTQSLWAAGRVLMKDSVTAERITNSRLLDTGLSAEMHGRRMYPHTDLLQVHTRCCHATDSHSPEAECGVCLGEMGSPTDRWVVLDWMDEEV
ncbi:unnamed protein product [Pleuronectes platessa]|uniref:Uncharacterized protein n=1 Tax=Pleuronectes platessa TaxID=8262 RepID=A0A9N7YLR8_PLEPL|nr:unnamed protein product [Pleuronectes platessa]